MFLIYEIPEGISFRTYLYQVNDCMTKGIHILKKSLNKDIYIRTTIATVFVRDFFHELGNSWLGGIVNTREQLKKN